MTRPLFLALLAVSISSAAEPPRLPVREAEALCQLEPSAAHVAESAVSFAPLLEKATPSVVSVFPAMVIEEGGSVPPIDRFFGVEPKAADDSEAPHEKITGVGSGVIVAADGWIVTNSHVVHLPSGKVADRFFVEMHDHRRFPAVIAGVDPETDLALLKIDAAKLPFLKFADSDEIRAGDRVFAIGNPFQVGMTATMGMVSATRRSNLGIGGEGAYQSFIQTDAAINPGNSGGALIDTAGRLAGINTAIYGSGGGNVGIGFAIPANLVRRVVARLAAEGKVTRGFFGIQIGEVTDAIARKADLPRMAGAAVEAVMPGSPAATAGVRAGDIVVKAAGQPVIYRGDLRFELSLVKPGETIELALWRAREETTVPLTAAAEAPPEATGEMGIAALPGAKFSQRDGTVTVVEVASAKLRKAGLETGMTVVEANGSPVDSLDSLAKALRPGVNKVQVRSQDIALTLALEAE